MGFSFLLRTDALVICILVFLVCLLMVVAGKFLRNKFVREDEGESRGGVNSLLGALFGLWGFLLAFTFGNSATRFENVRGIMVDETNAIRNVVLRSELFPDSIRLPFKSDLKVYVEERIDYYKLPVRHEKIDKSKNLSQEIFKKLWSRTVQVSANPALTVQSNNMFLALTGLMDVSSKRDALLLNGIPEPIVYMLFFLAFAISFIGGFTTPVMKAKEWLVTIGFALLATIVIYITLDLSRPLRGIIRPDLGEERLMDILSLI